MRIYLHGEHNKDGKNSAIFVSGFILNTIPHQVIVCLISKIFKASYLGPLWKFIGGVNLLLRKRKAM